MSTVLPGDLVSTGGRSLGSVGPGVRWEDDDGARATVAGVLKESLGNKIWVDFNRKRVTTTTKAVWLGTITTACMHIRKRVALPT